MSDPSLKAAIPTCEADLRVISTAYNMPKVMKEYVHLPPHEICVYHDNFLAHLNWKITHAMASNGILKYWFDYFLNFDMKPLSDPPSGPKVFDIEDLKFGFHVWLIACGVSALAFFSEILYFNVKAWTMKLIRNSIGLYNMLSFFLRQ